MSAQDYLLLVSLYLGSLLLVSLFSGSLFFGSLRKILCCWSLDIKILCSRLSIWLGPLYLGVLPLVSLYLDMRGDQY